MITKQVTVSGAVGKQVYNTNLATSAVGTQEQVLRGLTLYSPTSAGIVTIRSGNASGRVILEAAAVANDSKNFLLKEGIRFDDGMHVKVIGLDAVCYLYI